MSNKSYPVRMLEYMYKNDVTLTSEVARKPFAKEFKKLDSVQFNNSIMRTARYLFQTGLLSRKRRGEYTLTKKAKKMLSNG